MIGIVITKHKRYMDFIKCTYFNSFYFDSLAKKKLNIFILFREKVKMSGRNMNMLITVQIFNMWFTKCGPNGNSGT